MRCVPERLAGVLTDAVRQSIEILKAQPKRSLKDEKRLCELQQLQSKIKIKKLCRK